MNSGPDTTALTCPRCGTPVDPLRSPAVSVIEGRIIHFCSANCREHYLKRSISTKSDVSLGTKRPEEEKKNKNTANKVSMKKVPEEFATESATVSATAIELSAKPQTSQYRSKLLIHQLINFTVLALTASAIVLFPPLGGGLLFMGIAGAAILAYIGVLLWRERRILASRILEATATPIAAGTVLACVGMGIGPRFAAFVAVSLLAAESLGRLVEITGRRRSGVLDTVEGSTPLSVPSSWRDNSEMARKVKHIAIILGWVRYPLSILCALGTYLLSSGIPIDALMAGATALMAINPRTLRMATGDAHLGAALRAIANDVTIRDAHAVDSLARSRIMLFLAKRSLLRDKKAIVDWQTADNIKEQVALDALYAAEANAPGAIAEAAREFAISKSARASSPCPVEKLSSDGIVSDTPLGRVVCGSRMVMLNNGISTALLESQADAIETSGRSAVFLSIDGQIAAVFGLEEETTENAKQASTQLLQMGLEPAMAISKEVKAAQSLGARLGIERVYFNTSESAVRSVLEEIAASDDRVAIIGHGTAFEEHIRSAHAAIAIGQAGATQAGINARDQGILIVPWLAKAARSARLSATLNFIAGIGTVLFGLGLAASWFSPEVLLSVASMSFAVAAASTWNAPFPIVNRVRHRVQSYWLRLKALVTNRHTTRR